MCRKKRNPSNFSAALLIDQCNKHPKREGGFPVALHALREFPSLPEYFLERMYGFGQAYSIWMKTVLFAMMFMVRTVI